MSPTKRRHPTHISLPPRMMSSLSQDSDASAPSTPSPHTPLPYECGFGADLAAQHDKNGLTLDNLDFGMEHGPSVGMKRSRDDPEEVQSEPRWTDEEIDTIHSTLMHPYRPLKTSYPPGELPPPAVIDELANQILAFAFKPSPIKQRSRTASPSTSTSETYWKHTWDATRKKLFDIALAESKFGQEAGERKMSRLERSARPGLRRVDSMDFLDAAVEDAPQETVGRTQRLSTCLQNTARGELGSAGISRSSSESSIPSSGPSELPTAAINVIPASPEPASAPAPLRRKGSFRGLGSRPQRPTSLLQRGRSFTASDLAAEAEAEAKTDNTSPTTSPMVQSPTSSESNTLPPMFAPGSSTKLSSLTSIGAPRITRSQSSSSVLAPPHMARDRFLAPQPSTTDRTVLAMPLSLIPEPQPKSASGWSDSEDEGPIKSRATKKMKPQSKQKTRAMKIDVAVTGLGGGLRSPFEEKVEFGF